MWPSVRSMSTSRISRLWSKAFLKLRMSILADMEKISEMVSRVATATEQQTSASDEIALRMQGAAEVARQLRSTFTELRGSSRNLVDTAAELSESAKWFRL